jgi:hypothetical protein
MMLIKLEKVSDEMKQYLKMMDISSQEMDSAMRRLNNLLSEAEFIDPQDKK